MDSARGPPITVFLRAVQASLLRTVSNNLEDTNHAECGGLAACSGSDALASAMRASRGPHESNRILRRSCLCRWLPFLFTQLCRKRIRLHGQACEGFSPLQIQLRYTSRLDDGLDLSVPWWCLAFSTAPGGADYSGTRWYEMSACPHNTSNMCCPSKP